MDEPNELIACLAEYLVMHRDYDRALALYLHATETDRVQIHDAMLLRDTLKYKGTNMLTGAMLGLMERIALDIMILTDEISEAEFFASRMTRAQTLQLLRSLAQTAANLPAGTRERMPQIDWAAWAALRVVLAKPSQHPLQIWVTIKELTPLTVQQLNGYKKAQPQLFSIVP